MTQNTTGGSQLDIKDSLEKIKPIDILLVTYNRLNFLKETVKSIYDRTLYPYRLWVIDNNSDDGTRDWLKNAKINGFLHDYIFMDENVGLAGALSEGFKRVESDFFITTQDDILPPDLRPCWLERMLHLAENNPDYGGISMRIQRTRHREINETQDLIESKPSLASVFRIQRKEDIGKIGGFGNRLHWESTSFARRMMPLKKKYGVATHLYANHTGFMPDNKGFDDGFTTYHTYAKERVTQGKDQPYPEIDEKTNVPLKINTNRDLSEHKKREEYWAYCGVDKRRLAKLTQDQRILGEYAAEGKGIDVGCGRIKCHENAIGVDVFPFKSIDVMAAGDNLWMFNDDELDFVIASHSLEHFPDTKSVLKEWKRIVKPGGIIGVAVPDGEKRPNSVRGSHKVALTKEVLRIIFKFELNMKVIKIMDVPDKKIGKESIIVIAKK